MGPPTQGTTCNDGRQLLRLMTLNTKGLNIPEKRGALLKELWRDRVHVAFLQETHFAENKLKDLYNIYYPLEIDPNRTNQEKFPLMVEWWSKAHTLLCEQRIQKQKLAQIVEESQAKLREGFERFFDTLHLNTIPLFIFSAGIGDVLEEIIRQAGVYHPNIKVVSNYMDFDDEGFLIGFKGELIHTYNKNNSVLRDTEYFQQISHRSNILLLGDTLGDLTMAEGVTSMENILRIGFLNDKVEELMEQFLQSYDIVLVRDETLDVANGIINFITAKN